MAPGSAGCLCLQQEVLVQIPACRNVTVCTIVHLFVSVYMGRMHLWRIVTLHGLFITRYGGCSSFQLKASLLISSHVCRLHTVCLHLECFVVEQYFTKSLLKL